ncbi:zeta toxin family protein [Leptospira sp. 85282-16]|uniref:zeta toxin family protein n=1 Tax=Leptospira sp. 85282-16 TaxID=2971256 RepID=UPI0021BE1165|nr:zeta toxin family protein [Leptospira sp. 85282-16]MCT8335375.1 zeta toxin family protein [Leptospira sp. 85282-16]
MSKKRLRIFAGPNGSGKSSFIKEFENTDPRHKLGVYVNADEIEKKLKEENVLNTNQYKIHFTTEEIQSFFQKSEFSPKKTGVYGLWKFFKIIDNELIVDESLEMNSYISADLAEFLRQKLLESNISFSFETVMSDERKLNFLKKAKDVGYSIYLYFFCTVDPEINKNRVDRRVEEKGHSVPAEKIEERYYRSLENLKEAIRLSNRAFLFDTSSVTFDKLLFAGVTNGEEVEVFTRDDVPTWFIKYVVDKQ